MAFNASYEEGDIAESVVNTIVKAVITIGTLITIVVVVALYGFAKKRM